MKLRATVFSLVTLGLFAVPVCSFAQGSIVTAPVLTGDLSPVLAAPTGAPTFGDTPVFTLPVTGSDPVLRNGDGGGSEIGGGFGAAASPITPEPGTWGLLIGGVSGSLFALRRRKK